MLTPFNSLETVLLLPKEVNTQASRPLQSSSSLKEKCRALFSSIAPTYCCGFIKDRVIPSFITTLCALTVVGTVGYSATVGANKLGHVLENVFKSDLDYYVNHPTWGAISDWMVGIGVQTPVYLILLSVPKGCKEVGKRTAQVAAVTGGLGLITLIGYGANMGIKSSETLQYWIGDTPSEGMGLITSSLSNLLVGSATLCVVAIVGGLSGLCTCSCIKLCKDAYKEYTVERAALEEHIPTF
jgi:hypothetical protein